jgi:hypothetical protein
MVFAKYFIVLCVCVGALDGWMDVFVCTRVVNIWSVVRAENFDKSFCIDLCDSVYCIITAGVCGNALTWCCTHRQVDVLTCWAFYAVAWLCMGQVVGRRGELDLCVCVVCVSTCANSCCCPTCMILLCGFWNMVK